MLTKSNHVNKLFPIKMNKFNKIQEEQLKEAEVQIENKRIEGNKRLINLIHVSIICISIRLGIYLLPGEYGGLIIEILWIPLIFLIISIPFYGFEKLIDFIYEKEK